MNLFSIVRTQHMECLGCEEVAKSAAITARAIGSRVAVYSDRGHSARVERVSRLG